eukprot:XP_011682710.1 PREDICTED: peptidyl-prolyl cis-trans isomerase-like 4 [Strongylocentrotus purpuratus]
MLDVGHREAAKSSYLEEVCRNYGIQSERTLQCGTGEDIITTFNTALCLKFKLKSSLNFLKLCKIKYFNFNLIHSIQRNFMAQTGDPTGTGKGGASIFSKLYGDQAKYFEMENSPRIKHRKKGALSMVNNGENMHGSQFFLTLAEDLDYLDGQHTVFGEVTEGFDVLDKINEAFCDKGNRPYQDIRISHTIVLEDPFDDPDGLEIPDRSPEPTKAQLESGRIGADESIEDDDGKTQEELEGEEKKKDATANAHILEMVSCQTSVKGII